jgi:hypothetical protein
MIRRTALAFFLIVTLITALSCIERRDIVAPQSDLDRLVSWMAGSFSSQQQAAADSSYFDIRLEMVQIWPERTDGHWLYVEQAASSTPEQPYRQRVYHVIQPDDSTFASSVFELAEPARFVGAWRTPQLFEPLTPSSLLPRTGCTIFMTAEGDSAFVGRTVEQDCLSSLRGASYATSEVRIAETVLFSWDRGWDSTDTQVWGAEKGGYLFKKLSEE